MDDYKKELAELIVAELLENLMRDYDKMCGLNNNNDTLNHKKGWENSRGMFGVCRKKSSTKN